MAVVGSFVSGLIGASAPAVGSAAFAAGASVNTFLTTTFAGRMLSTVAISALSAALRTKPTTPGIRSQHTSTGGTTPASFILGWFASGGQEVCPPMSHGANGKTPNAYLTYVIELGDIPGQDLDGLLIDDELVTIGATPHADYGLPLEGKYAGHAWVKIYDGTQTVADPMLLDKYGSYPERPWNANMIGAGIPHLVLTFLLNREIFKKHPKIRAVTNGIPLYDPRKDDTVGGSGTHRWDDKSTWEPSSNNIVQAFNVMRGIALPSGDIWGGEIELEDLPLNNWMAGMNACDASIALDGGGSEPAFRSGIEVFVTDLPVDILLELGKAATAQFAESGGVFKVRVGGPGLPVMFLTDDDMSVSEPAELRPFRTSEEVHNGIHGTYPEPDASWQAKDAPPLYNATYEAEDGERRVANVNYAAVPYGNQVQRLNRAALKEERRFRQHSQGMCPEAKHLEPLDAIAWTSDANGYSAKIFEISGHRNRLGRSIPHAVMRERDSEDWNWQVSYEQPVVVPSPVVVLPPAQVLTGWTVSQTEAQDQNGGARGPGIRIEWPTDDVGIAGISYEIRVQATGTVVASGSSLAYDLGEIRVFAGIQPGVLYEVRLLIIPIGQRQTAWTGWIGVTAPTTRISSDWFRSEVTATVTGLTSAQVAAFFALDPAIPAQPGDRYVLRDLTDPDNPVEAGYLFDGVTWSDGGRVVSEAMMFDAAISARAIAALAVTADKVFTQHLAALAVELGAVSVSEFLRMPKTTSALLAGKTSAGDYLQQGFYLGRRDQGVFSAGNFVVSRQYCIVSVGTTDFVSLGAEANQVGETFYASGVGSGTGTARLIGYSFNLTSHDELGRLSGAVSHDGKQFTLLNARHLIGGSATGATADYTAPGSYDLGINTSVDVEAIADGSAGGHGIADGSGTGRAADGGDLVFSLRIGSATGTVIKSWTLTGGQGGANANQSPASGGGKDGEASPFGPAGVGRGTVSSDSAMIAGGDAPSDSFGAGGGGASADWPSTFDATGYGGEGGGAGEYVIETVDTSAAGAQSVFLVIDQIDNPGQGTGGDVRGGHGAPGVVRISAALAGMKEVPLGSQVWQQSPVTTTVGTSEAAMNAGDVDRGEVTIPDAIDGFYQIQGEAKTDTDAPTDESWVPVIQIVVGDEVVASWTWTQDDTPDTRTHTFLEFADFVPGETVKFRWKQNSDNDISKADLDSFWFKVTGPFTEIT